MNTPKEIYDTKRKNFVNKTKLHFKFLTSEFDFSEPTYTFSEQPNGTIVRDKFEFVNADMNLKITILNAYHPVDYGFEINLTDLNTGTKEMIHHVLTENQDVEQNYIEEASEFLKSKYALIIRRKN